MPKLTEAEFHETVATLEEAIEPWMFIKIVSPEIMPETPWELYDLLADARPEGADHVSEDMLVLLSMHIHATLNKTP